MDNVSEKLTEGQNYIVSSYGLKEKVLYIGDGTSLGLLDSNHYFIKEDDNNRGLIRLFFTDVKTSEISHSPIEVMSLGLGPHSKDMEMAISRKLNELKINPFPN